MNTRFFFGLFFLFLATRFFAQFTYPPEGYGKFDQDANLPIFKFDYYPDTIFQTSDKFVYFGKYLPIDLSFDHFTLVDISKENFIYKLRIYSPNAYALNAFFKINSFPNSAKLWTYALNQTSFYGPITNSYITKEGFSLSEHTTSSEMVLMLEVAKNELADVDFKIEGITHCFIPIKGANDSLQSESCMINSMCPEGDAFDIQRRSVARIKVYTTDNELAWCSGTLLNNTKEDGTPYLISANHCSANSTLLDINRWEFFFNYRRPTCTNSTTIPLLQFIKGADAVAWSGTDGGDSSSDFLLLKLRERIPHAFDAYFNGWDRSEIPAASSGAVVHHPNGDVQKISIFNSSPTLFSFLSGFTHLKVRWSSSASGFGSTQEGSSGSGLFNSSGNLIGTLTGGDASCSNLLGSDYFGRFYYSWDKYGMASYQQLKPWLDPIGSNAVSISSKRANDIITGIKESFKDEFIWRIFNSKLHIYNLPPNSLISINDISGKLLYSAIHSKEAIIDINHFPKSILILNQYSEISFHSAKIIH